MSQGEGPGLRVLVVDDERLFAELMRVALAAAEDIQVCGVVHDIATALTSVRELRPNVVLSDYHMPDGTGADVARTLRRDAPDVAVVVLTGDASASVLAEVARSGAVGHLTKSRGLDEVVHAVRSAAAGEILFAPSELQRLLLTERDERQLEEPLTARELEVLRLLASGVSTTIGSELLGISPATLRAHVQAILRKLGAHSRLEAVAEGARLGLITLETRSRERSPARGSALA